MSCTIGIFDSGLGGLTVMREVAAELPAAKIVYFGDTARLPYGEKSREAVIQYSMESARFLLENQVDILVIACNTASAFAFDLLREFAAIPVVGVIGPGARHAAETTKNGRVAVIGTRGTVASQVYEQEIARIDPNIEVITVACPLFVPLVEEGFETHPATELIAREYLASLKDSGVDTLLLGCTHYPLLKGTIQQVLGEGIAVIDSARCCAGAVAELCADKVSDISFKDISTPLHRYYVSDDPAKFKVLGERMFNLLIEPIEKVTTVH